MTRTIETRVHSEIAERTGRVYQAFQILRFVFVVAPIALFKLSGAFSS